MTNIFEALRDDHATQRSLVNHLVDTIGATVERKNVFGQLRAEMRAHATAEERFFYVPLMQDDRTQEKARHSVAEHEAMDELLGKLEDYELDASQWLITARQLQHDLHHHLDEEEQEVFQLAGTVLSEDAKTSLAGEYQGEMRTQRDGGG